MIQTCDAALIQIWLIFAIPFLLKKSWIYLNIDYALRVRIIVLVKCIITKQIMQAICWYGILLNYECYKILMWKLLSNVGTCKCLQQVICQVVPCYVVVEFLDV
jgi:hypothetical protein